MTCTILEGCLYCFYVRLNALIKCYLVQPRSLAILISTAQNVLFHCFCFGSNCLLHCPIDYLRSPMLWYTFIYCTECVLRILVYFGFIYLLSNTPFSLTLSLSLSHFLFSSTLRTTEDSFFALPLSSSLRLALKDQALSHCHYHYKRSLTTHYSLVHPLFLSLFLALSFPLLPNLHIYIATLTLDLYSMLSARPTASPPSLSRPPPLHVCLPSLVPLPQGEPQRD